jgi:TonB family protein
MRPRRFVVLALLLLCGCAAPPPTPVAAPSTPPPPPPVAAVAETVNGSVTVLASALNVRQEASTDTEVVRQLKKGAVLGVVRTADGWVRVRLDDGTFGWVAERFVGRPGVKAKKSGGKCPGDSDFAFEETPTLAFSDSGAHGMVVVEANVSANGAVTGTKVVSNSTGDEALAVLAQREIRSARFSPPIRSCVPRAFIFTYRRTF